MLFRKFAKGIFLITIFGMEFVTLLVILVAFYYLFKKLSRLPNPSNPTNHSKKNNESELAGFRVDAPSSSFDQQRNTRKQPGHQGKPTKVVRNGKDKDDESELADFRIEVSMGGFGQPKSRNKEPGRWVAPGETIKIDKFEINRGFLYVGGHLNSMDGHSTEASLVDPTLKINTNSPDYTGEYMDYWPSYDSITPKSRAAYLEWLASDRSDPETYIGYVFLYFYGLERRLLVDDRNGAVPYNEREALVLELKRLKDIYGHNRSFNNYATSFLSYLWILNPDCRALNELPSDDLLVAKRNFTSVFKFLLADTVQNGKPLNEELALAWVKSHPDYSLRTPARRCEDEFGVLFKLRYKARFGDGLKIKPNKTRLRLDYYTASASLRENHNIELDLPDASLLKAPVKKLMDLAESCTKELEPLSRFIGKPGNSRDSIRALSLLPNDLSGLISDSRLDRIRTWMNSRESVRDRLISVKSLFDRLGEKPPLKINKKEAEMLSAVVEKAGFGIAPDIRFHQAKPDVDGKIMLFPGGHGEDFLPSSEFRKVGTILRLGGLVAGIDNHIADSEISLLENLVAQNKKLKETEKRSLNAYMHWRLNTPASTAGLKKRLEHIGESDKVAISHILIGVALADGRVDPAEITQLEKLYGQLGFDKAMVTSDIHNLSSDRPPLVEQKRTTTVETSPDAKPAEAPSLSLDRDLLKLYEEETKDVQSVLESIFADDDVLDESETEMTPETPIPDGIISRLDAKYQNLYEKLITKEKWPLEEVEKLCQEQKLMTDGAVEVINDWTFDNVDAPLIDDGSVFYIDLEVAEEIATLQAQSQ